MSDEIANDEATAGAAASGDLSVQEQEQQLAHQDPSLASLIEQQASEAEQQLAADPQDARQIETEFEQEVEQEVGKVDPKLAQELADELESPPPITPVETPPSPAAIQEQEQQLAQQDPALASELEQQESEAQSQSVADPQDAAQIYEAFVATEVSEISAVDPTLAHEIQESNEQVNVTYNAEGEPTQGPAPTADVIGNPTADESQWSFQGANGYCGPDSISMMIEAATGHHLTEQQIETWAAEHGEMSPLPSSDETPGSPSIGMGMNPEEAAATITALGEQYGIKAELIDNGTISDLENYLGEGREVMIAIDATRIWHDGTDAGEANHFVVVTGFDPSTDTVYINDPGVPDGKAEAIPLSEFESAWETSGDVMIVTEPTGTGDAEAHDATEAQPAAATGPVLLPITLDARLVRPAA